MTEAGKRETLPLLLEIGCEEIPARFLREAEQGLRKRILERLDKFLLLPRETQPANQHMQANPVQTFSTPRRLTVYVPEMLARQKDVGSEILGPPVKVALDAEGKYTRAAESFARKNSARLEDLTRAITPKGDYLALRKIIRGEPALEKLRLILSGAIIELGMSFPKSMHWSAESKARFVRPIRWIVAVLGEGRQAATVEFDVLGVRSGNFTFGHRAYSKRAITVKGFRDYGAKLRRTFVEFDPEKRRQAIRVKTEVLLENSLALIEDAELEEWLVNSTEWPSAIRGGFDERFLHLPREILITVMRDHQKYFAVENREGKLEPYFVAILNIDSDERGLIRQGHERVLQARFSDAEFFWNADQRVPLRDRFERGMLDRVTYHADLGTYGDKANRMLRIGKGVSLSLFDEGRLSQIGISEVERAITLSKCDLTTQMVQEFPELQGVVGGLYAKEQGESDSVAEAVTDQYKPEGANDTCPRSLVGAVVSLADKIDAVVCGFVAGMVPSGSSDPFGLRRQGNGFVRVAIEFGISTNVASLVLEPIDKLSSRDPTLMIHTQKAKSLVDDIVAFIRERVGFHLESVEGLPYDVVRAALGARESTWSLLENNPCSIAQRARALNRVRAAEGFVKLCGAAKRTRNILSKSAEAADSLGGDFKEQLFEGEEEKSLGSVTQGVEQEARSLARGGNFEAALSEMTRLVTPIDRFFDKVLVMSPDRPARENRLRLLNRLNQMFSAVADLSQLVTP